MSNKGSGFVKYSVTAVACSVLTATAFSFLVFSTDVIVNVDVAEVEQAQMLYDRTSVSTVVDIIEDSGSSAADDIIYAPSTGITPTSKTNFIDFCLNIPFQNYLPEGVKSKVNEEKAYACLACYKACLDYGLTPKESVGLLACACNEGNPALVQTYFHLGGQKGTYDEPLYIKTPELVQAALAGDCDDATGAGTAQWTFERLTEYAKKLEPFVNKYGTSGDYTEYWIADYNMYCYDFSNDYKDLLMELDAHTSTPETTLVYSYFKYEAGFGNYKKTDRIADYPPHPEPPKKGHRENLEDRLPYAQAFYDAFNAYTPPPVPREGDPTP